MAITSGSKLLASDINSIKTNVSNAYKTTKGSAYSWANTISSGTLATYSHLSEIRTAIVNANSSLVLQYDCTNYSPYKSCKSYCSNKSNNTNHSQDNTGFFNNKCGGEWKQWLGMIASLPQKAH